MRPLRNLPAAPAHFAERADAAVNIPPAMDESLYMEVLGIALSGMQSASTKVAVSAHNLANLLTEDFRPQRATQTAQPGGGSHTTVLQSSRPEPVGIAREVVSQIQASSQYGASAKVFKVGAEMRGQLLDILA
ncbi:MAG: flagellar basal body rod protein [Deltaproteobacteria bacterium]|nr:flagellar basal body rod protein [Deltaproteobacteria bacterium]